MANDFEYLFLFTDFLIYYFVKCLINIFPIFLCIKYFFYRFIRVLDTYVCFIFLQFCSFKEQFLDSLVIIDIEIFYSHIQVRDVIRLLITKAKKKIDLQEEIKGGSSHCGTTGSVAFGEPWNTVWVPGLVEIWCCCSCGLGHNFGSDLIPGLGSSVCLGEAKKRKKQNQTASLAFSPQETS